MTGLARRLRRTARGDDGVTLVELLTVIVILGVVMAMVQGTILMANRTTDDVSGRLQSGSESRIAIDALSKNLRTAVLPQLVAGATCSTCATVAFVQGTPTSVQFYANNNADPARLGPSKMTYTLTNGVLTERQQKPDPHAANVFAYSYCTPGPSCKVTERVIARNVTSTRIFTYYDRAGAQLTGTTLNAAQLSRVDSIDITVTARSHPNVNCATDVTKCTTYVQRVTLPNADTVPEVTSTAA